MKANYSLKELAKTLKVSQSTIRNWNRSGKIIPIKTPTGRIYYTHDQYLELLGQKSDSSNDGTDLDVVRNKVVLITGGTGSLGQALCSKIVGTARKVIVYSRCELKQAKMMESFSNFDNIRYFIGDIRDRERLNTALKGVDIVIHAAALKRVEVCYYNPTEGINTNINGTVNVAQACIENGVSKALFVSTDKAAEPITAYGYMKALSENTWINFNNLSNGKTIFMATRYGNIINSNGSFYHTIKQQKQAGCIKITDPEMSRFYMTLEDAVNLNLYALNNSISGEIFIPIIKAASIQTFIDAFGDGCKVEIVGIRGVEKLEECLIAKHEMSNTYRSSDEYLKILSPYMREKNVGWDSNRPKEKPVKYFKYTSDSKDIEKYTAEELVELIDE